MNFLLDVLPASSLHVDPTWVGLLFSGITLAFSAGVGVLQIINGRAQAETKQAQAESKTELVEVKGLLTVGQSALRAEAATLKETLIAQQTQLRLEAATLKETLTTGQTATERNLRDLLKNEYQGKEAASLMFATKPELTAAEDRMRGRNHDLANLIQKLELRVDQVANQARANGDRIAQHDNARNQ